MKSTLRKILMASIVIGVLLTLPAPARAGLDGVAVFANNFEINRVCLGDGVGGFACSDVGTDTGESYGVALGYVNVDANLDAVFANRKQINRVCLGDGAGGFSCREVSR